MPKYRVDQRVLRNIRLMPNSDKIKKFAERIINTDRLKELTMEQKWTLLQWLKDIEKHNQHLSERQRKYIEAQIEEMYLGR